MHSGTIIPYTHCHDFNTLRSLIQSASRNCSCGFRHLPDLSARGSPRRITFWTCRRFLREPSAPDCASKGKSEAAASPHREGSSRDPSTRSAFRESEPSGSRRIWQNRRSGTPQERAADSSCRKYSLQWQDIRIPCKYHSRTSPKSSRQSRYLQVRTVLR